MFLIAVDGKYMYENNYLLTKVVLQRPAWVEG